MEKCHTGKKDIRFKTVFRIALCISLLYLQDKCNNFLRDRVYKTPYSSLRKQEICENRGNNRTLVHAEFYNNTEANLLLFSLGADSAVCV